MHRPGLFLLSSKLLCFYFPNFREQWHLMLLTHLIPVPLVFVKDSKGIKTSPSVMQHSSSTLLVIIFYAKMWRLGVLHLEVKSMEEQEIMQFINSPPPPPKIKKYKPSGVPDFLKWCDSDRRLRLSVLFELH